MDKIAWQTPKVDWKIQPVDSYGNYNGDWFNWQDYERIRGNIEYLANEAQSLWFVTVPLQKMWSMDEMVVEYPDYTSYTTLLTSEVDARGLKSGIVRELDPWEENNYYTWAQDVDDEDDEDDEDYDPATAFEYYGGIVEALNAGESLYVVNQVRDVSDITDQMRYAAPVIVNKQINPIERNLDILANNIYRPDDYPATKIWQENGKTLSFGDLNRWEGCCQAIYDVLKNTVFVGKKLPFTLNGGALSGV